jgi:hypothetical protein
LKGKVLGKHSSKTVKKLLKSIPLENFTENFQTVPENILDLLKFILPRAPKI